MELFKRETYLNKIRGFYHADDIIKVITGVRRCGKSSLMKTIAEELLHEGIDSEHIIHPSWNGYDVFLCSGSIHDCTKSGHGGQGIQSIRTNPR